MTISETSFNALIKVNNGTEDSLSWKSIITELFTLVQLSKSPINAVTINKGITLPLLSVNNLVGNQ